MLKTNPIQFAVVREDPRLDARWISELRADAQVLLIASGGCTAFSLQARFPRLELTLLDPNPAQLELVLRKATALRELEGDDRARAFNVGTDAPEGLNACGNFESLFRSLRDFAREFVAPAPAWEEAFSSPAAMSAFAPRVFAHRYWPVAFRLFFSDALLVAMFGPDAVQHAAPGSYPGYFQREFERGMSDAGAADNRFLQHVWLGRYLERSAPAYLAEPPSPASVERWRLLGGAIDAVEDFGAYEGIGLSNIFDWMPLEKIERIIERLSKEARPGTRVAFRQLNHSPEVYRRIRALFSGAFEIDEERDASWLRDDRSLFYSAFGLATRKPT